MIELLTVIVVLAIIALIATPIVLNIINGAKTSSNERSGELYVKAVENAIMKKQINGTDVVLAGDYTIQSDGSICIVSNNTCESGTTITIDVDGILPAAGGTITINEKGVVTEYNMTVSGTEIKKEIENTTNNNEDSNTLSCLSLALPGVDRVTIYFIESNNKVYFNMNDTWYYSNISEIEIENASSYEEERLDTFKTSIENFDESKELTMYLSIGSLYLFNYNNNWYIENADILTSDTIDKSIVESSIEFVVG